MNIYGRVGWRAASNAPAPEIITSGLILNLDAGNASSYPGTGTTWNDLSGNGRNATLANGVGYSSSNGGVLTFDGINDYGQVPTFTYPNSYSVAVWVRINYTNSTNYARILEKGLNNEFALTINKPARPDSYVYQLGDSSAALRSNSAVLSNYTLLTTTVENTSSSNYTIKFYINSTLDNTTTYTISFTKTNPLYFGGNPAALNLTAMFGEIGQIFMYDKILSQSEITQNYNAAKTRFGL